MKPCADLLPGFSWLYRHFWKGWHETSNHVSDQGMEGQMGFLLLFRVLHARNVYVYSDRGKILWSGTFPFPFLLREAFPFPSPSKVQSLQLALSVHFNI